MDPVSSPSPTTGDSRAELTGDPPGTTRPTASSDVDLLEVLGVLWRMWVGLIPIAEASGVRLPELGAELADFAAFVAQLPPEQAEAAGRVLAGVDAELKKLRVCVREEAGDDDA